MKKASLIVLFFFLILASDNFYLKARDMLAGVFFVDSSTETILKQAFQRAKNNSAQKVKILIVPGHDNESWGTQFKGITEAELNLQLGEELHKLLNQERYFNVTMSRTKDGYNPEFLTYLQNNKDAILQYSATQKNLMKQLKSEKQIQSADGVKHNRAKTDTALKLYGLNKWANDNKIDIVIHLHFNDYPGNKTSASGKYSGFSIYVPERQYSNSKGARALAEAINKKLIRFYPKSDLPKENTGIVEDQTLIAIGANNTLDGAGMLIEYGYIYEPAFTDKSLRDITIADLALQTYLGVMDFFGESTTKGGAYQTLFLPYQWQNDLKQGIDARRDIAGLQMALTLEALYPPAGKTKNDCAITGHFGSCTERSVKAFQEKYGIAPAEGFVGEQTRAKLNELYER